MNNQYSISKIHTRFLSKVYGWMSFGLITTAIISLFVATNPYLINLIFSNKIIFYGLILAQIGIVSYLSFGIERMKSSTATISFILYSVLTGLTLSSIFFIYTSTSIATVFLITSAMFAAMAIYGQFTNSDLSSMGGILTMILFGMIISSLVNLFFQNPTFHYIISALGVIVFSLLTAYDAQKIKRISELHSESNEELSKYSIISALSMYLNFINLFLYMLRFMGRRRD